MKQIVAALAAYFTRLIIKEWAHRLGVELWVSALISAAASAVVSTAILRA